MLMSQLTGYLIAMNEQRALCMLSEAAEKACRNTQYEPILEAYLDCEPNTTSDDVFGTFVDPDFYDYPAVCATIEKARAHIKDNAVPPHETPEKAFLIKDGRIIRGPKWDLENPENNHHNKKHFRPHKMP